MSKEEIMPQSQQKMNISEEERQKEIEKRRKELYIGKSLKTESETESVAVVKKSGAVKVDIESFRKANLEYMKNQAGYLKEHGKKPELKDFPMKIEEEKEIGELALEELEKLEKARTKIQELKEK